MKHSMKLRSLLVLGLMLTMLFSLSFAQTSNGTIAGTVTDPSGAAVTNATITSKSVQTGESRTVTTNNVGSYRIESVSPGDYLVTVSSPGFVNTELKNVQVTGSVVTSINIKLKIGTSETISVEANAVQLQTDSGEISSTIQGEEVSNLPIGGLNPYSLALTLPGVTSVNTADFTNGTSYSVDGTRPRANNFLIEGQDNNDAGIHGQGIQPGNLEAIKEVTFLTNSYSAEFGHGGGSVANVIFKTGSNSFHGSVWDRILNSSLDASDKQDILNGSDKSKYRENLFGFSFGGPIKKDKLFFFTSYQWDKYRASANLGVLTVPTTAGVATLQALSSNPRVANLLSAIGSTRGINDPSNSRHSCIKLGLDPVSGLDRGCVEVNAVQRSLGAAYDSPEFDAKGDWLVTKNDTLNFRYIHTKFSAPYDIWNYPSQLPGFDATQYGPTHNAGITYTHIFSPTLINEFRTSYGRIGFTFDFAPNTYKNPLALGPTTSISGITGFGAPSGDPQGRFHNTYQLQDSISWTKGNHFLKIGLDLSDTRVRDAVPFNFYGSLSYTRGVTGGYTALANYIDDYSGVSNASLGKNFGSPIARPQLISQSYFFQDSWKMRPNLTVDLGFRYEYSGAPFNSIKNPALAPTKTCFTCYVPQESDGSNVGPRLGIAYTPRFWKGLFGDNKTVLRGGFGVFYDQLFTNIVDNIQAAAPAAASPLYTINTSAYGPRGVANWSTYFAALPTAATAKNTSQPITPHLLNPMTVQWNLNVQRQLPGNFVATVAYVGTRGEHLLANTELNPTVAFGPRLDTTRGRIIIRDNSGDSMYHSLAATLERKFTKGMMFRAAYTYAKYLDDTSEIFSTGNWSSYPVVQYPSARKTTDWGLSAFDHRQRLALSYVYEIPQWKVNDNYFLKGVAAIVNNWQISGTSEFQSGSPANVFVGYDVNGDGISNDRPMLGSASAPMTTYAFEGSSWMGTAPGVWCEGGAAWNTNDPCVVVDPKSVHWLVPEYATNGKVIGRNSLISPGTQNWDFSIQRTIKIREKQSFQIRAEMFNVFNHGNTDVSGTNFTLTTGILPSSIGTTSFGDYASSVFGHRSVRFLLKYAF